MRRLRSPFHTIELTNVWDPNIVFTMIRYTVRVIRHEIKMPSNYVDAYDNNDDNHPGPYWHEEDQIAKFITLSLSQLDYDLEAHSWEFKQVVGKNFIFQGILHPNIKNRSLPTYAV